MFANHNSMSAFPIQGSWSWVPISQPESYALPPPMWPYPSVPTPMWAYASHPAMCPTAWRFASQFAAPTLGALSMMMPSAPLQSNSAQELNPVLCQRCLSHVHVAPADDAVSVEDVAPADDAVSSEDAAPVEDVVSGEDAAPVEDAVSGEDAALVEDVVSGEDAAPVEDASRAHRKRARVSSQERNGDRKRARVSRHQHIGDRPLKLVCIVVGLATLACRQRRNHFDFFRPHATLIFFACSGAS